MPQTLPNRPNLDYLKQHAKNLLHAYHAGEDSALQLFAHHLPAKLRAQPLKLSHAQLVLARTYGFSSWPKLTQHIHALPAEAQALSQRELRDQARQARKVAHQQHIAKLADRLLAAARKQDLWALFAAFQISARDLHEVRAYLVEKALYTLVIDALLFAAEQPHDRLRFLAAQAIDHFADDRCAATLTRLLRDPVPRVRWAAIHSLQCADCKLAPLPQLGDTTATLIELALHDPSIKVRRVATYELGQTCADARALAALELITAQATDQVVLRNARHALAAYRRAG